MHKNIGIVRFNRSPLKCVCLLFTYMNLLTLQVASASSSENHFSRRWPLIRA